MKQNNKDFFYCCKCHVTARLCGVCICIIGAAVDLFLKKDKQYVIRIPFIDGWIYNGHYFFHVWNRTTTTLSGQRLNWNKKVFTLSNF